MEHIPKELNEITYYMTKITFNTGQDMTVFKEIPVISSINKASINLTQNFTM